MPSSLRAHERDKRAKETLTTQNIALKCRADFRRFSRIWAPETIRARAAKI
jgi:hypothetical protein